ncbi:unnamed protein product [Moneuplotes crassus]|uniref:Uncharacterized protein n=1 Tax=Euplotes crassus TaxID=5936 RepID=A0AAD1XAH4_EUPCR|nr:unnamed protein product [Moneuplotes crassus]
MRKLLFEWYKLKKSMKIQLNFKENFEDLTPRTEFSCSIDVIILIPCSSRSSLYFWVCFEIPHHNFKITKSTESLYRDPVCNSFPKQTGYKDNEIYEEANLFKLTLINSTSTQATRQSKKCITSNLLLGDDIL